MQKDKKIKPLNVYNASAGSGKTFQLVKTYLLIALSNKLNPKRFSQMLAMTFTNKAALEMKTRIIAKLDELAHNTNHEKNIDLSRTLCEALDIDEAELNARSKAVLTAILHNYEDFNVMTIDKFNLRLIRSFSRDLDIAQDFEVILNETELIEQTVDLLLEQLGTEDMSKLTKLILEYTRSNIEEGQKWQIRQSLINFASVLKQEKDLLILEELAITDFSLERRSALINDLNQLHTQFTQACQHAYTFYLNLNLDESRVPNKSRTTGVIHALNAYNKIPVKDLFSPQYFVTITKAKNWQSVFPPALLQTLEDLNELHRTLLPQYAVLQNFVSKFYDMALLQFISKTLTDLRKNEQVLRISEFNKLISELVSNEEAPFIYERLGNRFTNFLLDEFQDTSRLQWLNIVPLLHESLGKNEQNLIVGDPKQSIYRFKNGVAEQFVKLPRIYNPELNPSIELKSDFFESSGNVIRLEENWRSSPIIVQFNNSFFENFLEHIPDRSLAFYNSVIQHPMSDKSGFVDVISKKEELSDLDLVPTIMDKIAEAERLGFRKGDICILSEKNKHAAIWAMELTRNGIPVVSSESLLLINDPHVQLTMHYLKLRLKPSSDNFKKLFIDRFLRLSESSPFIKYRSYIEKYEYKGKTYTQINDSRFIADYFGSTEHFFKKYENLYDLIQHFFSLMSWNELNSPYLHQFSDIILDFETTKGPDLASFISYFDSKSDKFSIQTPKNEDSIEIMTIHKSKGLEFPVVIIPSIDFMAKPLSNSKYLIETDDFILHTTLSEKSPIPAVRNYRDIEHDQTLTDKINLAYVALTRPESCLFIINYWNNSFGQSIHKTLEKLEQSSQNEEGELTLRLISDNFKPKLSSHKKIDDFIPENFNEKLWFPDISIRQKTEDQRSSLSLEQQIGNQFHALIAQLDTFDQFETTFRKLELEGLVDNKLKASLKLQIEKVFFNAEIKTIQANSTYILNEQNILASEESTFRPDRIIIKPNETIVLDFKTGLVKANHVKQVQAYKKALDEMGLPNIKGFIYYTEKDEILPVN